MAIIELWKDRKNNIIDPELFSVVAESLAIKVDQEGRDHRGNPKKNLSSQLRKFYDEIVRLNLEAKSQPEKWNIIVPRVHMIVAKTAYAEGRQLITPSFVSIVRDGIADIHDSEDLAIFASFLEAFIGFYKKYRPKN